jgi:hypothetical protein
MEGEGRTEEKKRQLPGNVWMKGRERCDKMAGATLLRLPDVV